MLYIMPIKWIFFLLHMNTISILHKIGKNSYDIILWNISRNLFLLIWCCNWYGYAFLFSFFGQTQEWKKCLLMLCFNIPVHCSCRILLESKITCHHTIIQVQIFSVYTDLCQLWGLWRMKRTKAQRRNLHIFGAQKVKCQLLYLCVCI